jgi:hypothetical protein
MRQSGARGQRQPDAASNDRQHNERESFGRPAEETNSTPLKAKRKTPRRWTWQHADDPLSHNCPRTHRAGDAAAAQPALAGGCAAFATRTIGGFNADTDCSRTRAWIACGRGLGHGLCAAADWMRTVTARTRLGRGHGLFSDWTRSRTGQGHGRLAGLWRGHSASKPRPFRGHKNLS